MKTEFVKAFDGDVENIIAESVIGYVEKAILNVRQAATPRDILNLRKLQGFKDGKHFRIRIRRYRIGVIIIGDLVTFERCLPKKEFYRKYTKKLMIFITCQGDAGRLAGLVDGVSLRWRAFGSH